MRVSIEELKVDESLQVKLTVLLEPYCYRVESKLFLDRCMLVRKGPSRLERALSLVVNISIHWPSSLQMTMILH